MTTEKKEEYLECIYKLQQTGEATVTELAENLKLVPSSVSEMIQKLKEEGLIIYENKSIGLTQDGEKIALNVIRKHRLAECFFINMLGLKWEDVHEEACRFEHVLSDKVADALEEVLGHPVACPHGNPVPDEKGHFKEGWDFNKVEGKNILNMLDLKSQEEAFISKITGESHNFLKYLSTLGLIPQAKIKIEQIAPFCGPVLVSVGGAKYALGRGVASRIWVKKI